MDIQWAMDFLAVAAVLAAIFATAVSGSGRCLPGRIFIHDGIPPT